MTYEDKVRLTINSVAFDGWWYVVRYPTLPYDYFASAEEAFHFVGPVVAKPHPETEPCKNPTPGM